MSASRRYRSPAAAPDPLMSIIAAAMLPRWSRRPPMIPRPGASCMWCPSTRTSEQPMSAAAISILVYAIYLFGQGISLLLIPNTVLPILGLPLAADHWVRVVGMTVVFFGVYYVLAARSEWRSFFATTVVTRLAVPLIFAGLVATNQAPAGILLLTPADILFSAWT